MTLAAGYTVRLFEARCAACANPFAKPELGDFAYGQFVFTGEFGTAYAYFEAIGHPVWDCLAAAAPALNDKAGQGHLIQAACAYFADPIEEQRLCNHPVCPKCLSKNLSYWSGRKLGEAEIAVVSFSRFASLSEQDRLRKAKAFYARDEGDGFAFSPETE
jgi:hypothetical protein